MNTELLLLILFLLNAGGLIVVIALVSSAVKDHYRKKKAADTNRTLPLPQQTGPPPGWEIVHNGQGGFACSLSGHVWFAWEPLPTYETAVRKSWEHYQWCLRYTRDKAQWKPLDTNT